jgi:2-Cys peroxiredoxin 5
MALYLAAALLALVGDRIPSITLDQGWGPPNKINLAERTAGKKVLLLGLPGAFTPT